MRSTSEANGHARGRLQGDQTIPPQPLAACGVLGHVACLVYIDETGSVGKGASKQALLTLVAVLVDEDNVQPLGLAFRQVARDHLGWLPADFELHGQEVWNGTGYWMGKTYDELIAAYEQAIAVLETLHIDVSYASIHKQRLHDRYDGAADGNAYVLALQFLLEKIDAYRAHNKILIAYEAKEHQVRHQDGC